MNEQEDKKLIEWVKELQRLDEASDRALIPVAIMFIIVILAVAFLNAAP